MSGGAIQWGVSPSQPKLATGPQYDRRASVGSYPQPSSQAQSHHGYSKPLQHQAPQSSSYQPQTGQYQHQPVIEAAKQQQQQPKLKPTTNSMGTDLPISSSSSNLSRMAWGQKPSAPVVANPLPTAQSLAPAQHQQYPQQYVPQQPPYVYQAQPQQPQQQQPQQQLPPPPPATAVAPPPAARIPASPAGPRGYGEPPPVNFSTPVSKPRHHVPNPVNPLLQTAEQQLGYDQYGNVIQPPQPQHQHSTSQQSQFGSQYGQSSQQHSQQQQQPQQQPQAQQQQYYNQQYGQSQQQPQQQPQAQQQQYYNQQYDQSQQQQQQQQPLPVSSLFTQQQQQHAGKTLFSQQQPNQQQLWEQQQKQQLWEQQQQQQREYEQQQKEYELQQKREEHARQIALWTQQHEQELAAKAAKEAQAAQAALLQQQQQQQQQQVQQQQQHQQWATQQYQQQSYQQPAVGVKPTRQASQDALVKPYSGPVSAAVTSHLGDHGSFGQTFGVGQHHNGGGSAGSSRRSSQDSSYSRASHATNVTSMTNMTSASRLHHAQHQQQLYQLHNASQPSHQSHHQSTIQSQPHHHQQQQQQQQAQPQQQAALPAPVKHTQSAPAPEPANYVPASLFANAGPAVDFFGQPVVTSTVAVAAPLAPPRTSTAAAETHSMSDHLAGMPETNLNSDQPAAFPTWTSESSRFIDPSHRKPTSISQRVLEAQSDTPSAQPQYQQQYTSPVVAPGFNETTQPYNTDSYSQQQQQQQQQLPSVETVYSAPQQQYAAADPYSQQSQHQQQQHHYQPPPATVADANYHAPQQHHFLSQDAEREQLLQQQQQEEITRKWAEEQRQHQAAELKKLSLEEAERKAAEERRVQELVAERLRAAEQERIAHDEAVRLKHEEQLRQLQIQEEHRRAEVRQLEEARQADQRRMEELRLQQQEAQKRKLAEEQAKREKDLEFQQQLRDQQQRIRDQEEQLRLRMEQFRLAQAQKQTVKSNPAFPSAPAPPIVAITTVAAPNPTSPPAPTTLPISRSQETIATNSSHHALEPTASSQKVPIDHSQQRQTLHRDLIAESSLGTQQESSSNLPTVSRLTSNIDEATDFFGGYSAGDATVEGIFTDGGSRNTDNTNSPASNRPPHDSNERFAHLKAASTPLDVNGTRSAFRGLMDYSDTPMQSPAVRKLVLPSHEKDDESSDGYSGYDDRALENVSDDGLTEATIANDGTGSIPESGHHIEPRVDEIFNQDDTWSEQYATSAELIRQVIQNQSLVTEDPQEADAQHNDALEDQHHQNYLDDADRSFEDLVASSLGTAAWSLSDSAPVQIGETSASFQWGEAGASDLDDVALSRAETTGATDFASSLAHPSSNDIAGSHTFDEIALTDSEPAPAHHQAVPFGEEQTEELFPTISTLEINFTHLAVQSSHDQQTIQESLHGQQHFASTTWSDHTQALPVTNSVDPSEHVDATPMQQDLQPVEWGVQSSGNGESYEHIPSQPHSAEHKDTSVVHWGYPSEPQAVLWGLSTDAKPASSVELAATLDDHVPLHSDVPAVQWGFSHEQTSAEQVHQPPTQQERHWSQYDEHPLSASSLHAPPLKADQYVQEYETQSMEQTQPAPDFTVDHQLGTQAVEQSYPSRHPHDDYEDFESLGAHRFTDSTLVTEYAHSEPLLQQQYEPQQFQTQPDHSEQRASNSYHTENAYHQHYQTYDTQYVDQSYDPTTGYPEMSYHVSSYDGPERLRNNPASVAFGFGGTLVTIQGTTVKIAPIKSLLPTIELELIQAFPGPLTPSTDKADVMQYISLQTTNPYAPNYLLWRVLEVWGHCNDTQHSTAFRLAVAELLLDSSEAKSPSYSSVNQPPAPTAGGYRAVMRQLAHLVARGHIEDAVNCAADAYVWDHAFLLASKCQGELGLQLMQKVTEKFAQSFAQSNSDPFAVLYALFGEDVVLAKQLAVASLKNWRYVVALLLQQYPHLSRDVIVFIGEQLLLSGAVIDAHVCFLAAAVDLCSISHRRGKMALLGFDHAHQTTFSSESLYLTEVYEFLLTRAEPRLSLPMFQSAKLRYASMLCDLGLCELAELYASELSRISRSATNTCGLLHQHFLTTLADLQQRLTRSKSTLASGLDYHVHQQQPSSTDFGLLDDHALRNSEPAVLPTSDASFDQPPSHGQWNEEPYAAFPASPTLDTSAAVLPHEEVSSPNADHSQFTSAAGFYQPQFTAPAASNAGIFEFKPTDIPVIQQVGVDHTKVDDDEDFLAFTKKKKSTDENQEAADEVTEDKKPAKDPWAEAEALKKSQSSGWLGGLVASASKIFAKRESGGYTQAHLKTETSFYYDEKRKRWISKDDPEPEDNGPPPPPPSDLQLSASSVSTPGTPLHGAQSLPAQSLTVGSHGRASFGGFPMRAESIPAAGSSSSITEGMNDIQVGDHKPVIGGTTGVNKFSASKGPKKRLSNMYVKV